MRDGSRTTTVPAAAVILAGVIVLAFAWWMVRPERDLDLGSAPAPTSVVTGSPGGGAGTSAPTSGLPTVPESRLPEEAQQTLTLVRAGGPFPYREDGAAFGNREALLPVQPYGYYREFTVATPGEADRGPRRLVVGTAGDVYWTTDHYASFEQVEVGL